MEKTKEEQIKHLESLIRIMREDEKIFGLVHEDRDKINQWITEIQILKNITTPLSDNVNDCIQKPHAQWIYKNKVKEFVAERIQESTKLLVLFNQGKLTSIDLREHRQKIKDEAGDL